MRSALAVKVKRGRALSAKNLAKNKSKNKAKVIALVTRKPKRQVGLTAEQREQLVIDFRIKARKLGRSIMRKWNARLDLQEVDSIVDLSLCEAVKRFNPRKASFITFLYYHLRGNLIRAISSAASQNMVPMFDPEGSYNSDDGSYSMPNSSEVAAALTHHDGRLPDDLLFQKEIIGHSNEACASLDQLERQVIERIYLNEEQVIDVAESLGYSRCHISRVKKKALTSLHSELKGKIGADLLADGPDFDEDNYSKRRAVRRRKLGAIQNFT